MKSIVRVLHVMCTNNDGMENHNRNWGVVFKVAEKMRDAGVRPPPHPPRQPPALCNLGWGCVFTRRWGFRGWIRLLKGKKGRDGGLR